MLRIITNELLAELFDKMQEHFKKYYDYDLPKFDSQTAIPLINLKTKFPIKFGIQETWGSIDHRDLTFPTFAIRTDKKVQIVFLSGVDWVHLHNQDLDKYEKYWTTDFRL